MGSTENRQVGNLQVDPVFHDFVEDELLPAIDFNSARFWGGLESLITDLTPTNRELLARRDALQLQIDDWHIARQGEPWKHAEYSNFLCEIGYLREPGESFQITTDGVDPEIASIAGPQLVVPVANARFALNAPITKLLEDDQLIDRIFPPKMVVNFSKKRIISPPCETTFHCVLQKK